MNDSPSPSAAAESSAAAGPPHPAGGSGPTQPPQAMEAGSPAPSRKATDFSQVSQRIGNWAMNGLASAVVLVVGLAAGREMIQWWREDATPDPRTAVWPGDAADDPLAEGARDAQASAVDAASIVRMGDQGRALSVLPVRGDATAARAALVQLCCEIARGLTASSAKASEGERRLLGELAGRSPLEEREGVRIDVLPGEAMLPMVAASRTAQTGDESSRRIVVLGTSAPQDDQHWTLYAFPLGDGELAAASPCSLPEGSRVTMSWRDAWGRTTTAFSGGGKLDDWELHFRTGDRASRWEVGPFSGGAERRLAKITAGGPSAEQGELVIGSDPSGRLWGLITTARTGDRKDK